MLAVDLKAKKVAWTYKHPERNFPFYSSPTLAGDRVIVGGRDKMVHALDRKTGKSLWTFATGARVDSSPVVVGGRAYIGSNDGKLYVLDVAVGQERVPVRSWRSALGVAGCRRWHGSSSARRTASCSASVSARPVRGAELQLRDLSPAYFRVTVARIASYRISIAGPRASTGTNSASPCIDATASAGTITGVKP